IPLIIAWKRFEGSRYIDWFLQRGECSTKQLELSIYQTEEHKCELSTIQGESNSKRGHSRIDCLMFFREPPPDGSLNLVFYLHDTVVFINEVPPYESVPPVIVVTPFTLLKELEQLLKRRATLAEKEVSALKEQLATANQNLQLIEGKGGGGNKPPGGGGGGGGGDMDQTTMEIISRSGLEVELAAKEKELKVKPIVFLIFKLAHKMYNAVQKEWAAYKLVNLREKRRAKSTCGICKMRQKILVLCIVKNAPPTLDDRDEDKRLALSPPPSFYLSKSLFGQKVWAPVVTGTDAVQQVPHCYDNRREQEHMGALQLPSLETIGRSYASSKRGKFLEIFICQDCCLLVCIIDLPHLGHSIEIEPHLLRAMEEILLEAS
ncbi:hypothetical protein C0J52_25643, partial [Blattella germanica]